MTRPTMQPDNAGYLPNGRPTAERLLADAQDRLDRAEALPAKLAAIRGWAANDPGNVRVTVNSLGELVDLELAESVMAADPRALAAEILRLSGDAFRAATAAAIDELAPVIGDAEVLDLARAAGLGDRIDPDAPVIADAGSPGAPRTDWQHDDDDLSQFDFSQFRSDR